MIRSGRQISVSRRRLALLTILLFCGFVASIRAQSKDLNAVVAARMAETRTPGMAVAVVVDGKVVHAQGYGVANLETESKVTEKTVFNLASITKTFTALAVMKLVESGKLSLDDGLAKHLNDIPAAWKPITIRELLSSTSGIRSFTELSSGDQRCNASQDTRTYKRGDAVKEVACLPLEFTPGEKWKYADTGFYLAGMVIEKLSGQEYGSFLTENIFTPLGMRNTALINYSAIVPNRANGYSFKNGQIVNAGRFDIDEFANGGLTSTLEDMIRFEQAFLTEKVLKRASIDTMLSGARLKNGEVVRNYGLGIGLTPYNGKKRFGHTGGGGLGFATAFTHFPETGTTVVVLANADQEGIGDFANSIAEMYFSKITDEEKRRTRRKL